MIQSMIDTSSRSGCLLVWGRFEVFIRHDTRFLGYQSGSEGDHISGIGSSAGKQLVNIDEAVRRRIVRILNRCIPFVLPKTSSISSRLESRDLHWMCVGSCQYMIDGLAINAELLTIILSKDGANLIWEIQKFAFAQFHQASPEEAALTFEKDNGGAEISDYKNMGVPLGLW